ncbi:MAG TPA: maleylacetate reductase [Solirubrobacterales bacterium]|nr:maleylacetate reductase [Solirubrobacterales bacterium]
MTGDPIDAKTFFAYEGLPGRVVFGAGSLAGAGAEIERLGRERALLLVGPAMSEAAAELARSLGGGMAGCFQAIRPHVPVATAAEAVAAARAREADCLLALGGGSTIGTAKAVALETGLPIVAVPTTYAGSEMTPVWGSTAGDRKTTGRDARVLPKVVLYDPELTLTLPPVASAASGMNALAHGVEALYAPGRNPLTSLIAEAAIGALAESLPAVTETPGDLSARAAALYGAHLAGAAFALAGSGLHHRICHVLGGAYDLPHAETHGILLPHVVAFQEPAAPEPMARVALALGAAEGEPAAAALRRLAGRMGAPQALREVGMPADGIEPVIPAILEVAPPDNPRPVGAEDIASILRAAY